MTIKSEITQEDYAAFVKHVGRSVSSADADKLRRVLVGTAVGLGVGLAWSLVNAWVRPTTVAALICGALAGAFFLLAVMSGFLRRQMERMRPAEGGFILGRQETCLADEGIQQKSGQHHSVFQWSLVREVTVTEQHVFVMLDRVAGIILPRRTFSSTAELEAFVSEVERRSGKLRTYDDRLTVMKPAGSAGRQDPDESA